MRKHSFFVYAALACALVGSFTAVTAYAATPTLSLTYVGGSSVQVTVNGDANSSVVLYYNIGSASGMQLTTLGTTSISGSFSITVNSSAYNINSGNSVYVIVNGQQSAMQSWPAYTASSGTPTLSQTSITLGLGQSMTVTSQSGAAVYMASNSNPTVASAVSNNSQVTVTGNQLGSTVLSICYVGTASNCASLSVNVQSTAVATLTLSQTNLSMSSGNNQTVVISGGTGTYNVSSNSNPTAVSTNLSGSTLTVYAINTGSATINICDSSNNCGSLFVTVNGSSTSNSLTFSQTSPYLTVGQTAYIYVYGGSGYYVTSNTNPSIVSQSISGSTLTISGLNNGTSVITVCSSANGCGTVNVSVGSSTSGTTIAFGLTNPILSVGQTVNVSLSNGSGYYISSNTNSTVVQASISGNSLVLYGAGAGSSSITVCASGSSCNTTNVTVTGSGTTTTTVDNSALLAQVQALQSTFAQILTQMQSVQTQLTQLLTKVGALQTGTSSGSTSSGTSSSVSYQFSSFLALGSQGNEVTALQAYLTRKGFYSGPVTGYYGSLTESAVKAYQKAHGINDAGYVGPSTRAALNAGE